jgi:putative hemolysin
MTPLLLFLLGVAAVYVSTVITAFSALMRLSLRLMAERNGREDLLGLYLDQPLRLFIPARLLLAIVTVAAVSLLARVTGLDAGQGLPLLAAGALVFVIVCEHILPLLLVRRNPERVLDMLLPSFEAITRVLQPLTAALGRMATPRHDGSPVSTNVTEQETTDADSAEPQRDGDALLQEGQARELLRSLVEFRETTVREVMTPRPDMVGIEASATIGELRALAREQQYSRVPVYNETLDNIVGMITIKDLILLDADASQPVTPLVRSAYFVPETKRVFELLKEFQRKRIQAALVVDEYGGTSGLVTVEDLLEEIVGEIQDEYDVEIEPVAEEPDGSFVFSGRAHVREIAEHTGIDVAGEGYETVGGYLMAHVGRVPLPGETFDINGLSVEVLETERRRIGRVRVRRIVEQPDEIVQRVG